MKRLNEDALKPGDIALATTSALISKAIRRMTNSDVSHAMLYITHCSIVHAMGDGVHAENTQRILFNDDAPVHVLRLKDGLSAEKARELCNFVREAVGTEYSTFEASKAISNKCSISSRKQFCSRLIAQAYDRVGYRIVPNPLYCAPGAFLNSDLLERLPQPTKAVSDGEAAFYKSEPDRLADQKRCLNSILKQARAFDRNIQSFSDIGHLVMKRPELDNHITQVIQSSGFLGFRDEDLLEYPWRYDIALMEKIPQKQQVAWYCRGTLQAEPRDNNRFTISLAGLKDDFSRAPRQTLTLLIDLYERLVATHATRVDVAALWLERHGDEYAEA